MSVGSAVRSTAEEMNSSRYRSPRPRPAGIRLQSGGNHRQRRHGIGGGAGHFLREVGVNGVADPHLDRLVHVVRQRPVLRVRGLGNLRVGGAVAGDPLVAVAGVGDAIGVGDAGVAGGQWLSHLGDVADGGIERFPARCSRRSPTLGLLGLWARPDASSRLHYKRTDAHRQFWESYCLFVLSCPCFAGSVKGWFPAKVAASVFAALYEPCSHQIGYGNSCA